MFQFSHSIGAQNEARKQFVVDDGGGWESVAKKTNPKHEEMRGSMFCYLELDASRHDNRSEGQRMRANGRHHYSRHAGMDHRRSSRHRVGRRTGRRRYDQT